MAITAASVSYLVAPPHALRSEVWSLGLVSLDVDDPELQRFLLFQLLSNCYVH